MLQLKNKQKIYFYIFALLFLSSINNNNILQSLKNLFLIKHIYIDVKNYEVKNILSLNMNFIKSNNIFFVKKDLIRDKLNVLNFLENIKINRILPSTISIKASKTEFIAITYIEQKKFFVGSNGKFISSSIISDKKKLPTIFGRFEASDFIFLKKLLHLQNIDQENIDKYYFHKNKRWDIYFNNNVLLMLPNKDIESSIVLFQNFKKKNEITPGTIIDLRIPNRLILKNG